MFSNRMLHGARGDLLAEFFSTTGLDAKPGAQSGREADSGLELAGVGAESSQKASANVPFWKALIARWKFAPDTILPGETSA